MVTTGTYTHVVKACTNAGETSQARDLLAEMRANGMPVKRATVAMVEKCADRRSGRGPTRETWQPPAATMTGNELEQRWSPAAAGRDGVELAQPSTATAAAADDADASRMDHAGNDSFSPATPASSSAGGGGDGAGAVSISPPPSPQQTPPPTAAAAAAVASPKSARVRNVKQFLLAVGSHSRNRRYAEIVADLDAAMADPRTKVSMRMYEGCLYGLASGGKWVEALAVLEKMQAVGLKPNSSCVTGAIKACGKANPPKWGLALSLLRGLEEPEVRRERGLCAPPPGTCGLAGPLKPCRPFVSAAVPWFLSPLLLLLPVVILRFCTYTTVLLPAVLSCCPD